MSGYQYYEFYAIDRELTKQERDEVDGLSTRFSPTSRRAIFQYSYSDFRHDEELVFFQYFDFFLYLSSWGTKRIMYKFPQELVNYEGIKQYDHSFDTSVSNEINIYKESEFVIIDINLSEEEGDFWIEEQSYLSAELIGLRQDILNGDYRALFIIWLHIKNLEYNAEEIDLDSKILKQLIPDNLGQFNSGLKCLMELYEVNADWISGVSKYSGQSNSQKENYIEVVKKLSIDKKNDYLMRILDGELNLNIKLKKELEKIAGIGNEKQQKTEEITLKELVGLINKAEAKRKILEQEEVERKRLNTLKEIEKNKEIIIKEIDYHIKRGSGKSYDEALRRIRSLNDLAKHQGQELEFKKWINKLKEEVANKPAMFKRIEGQGL